MTNICFEEITLMRSTLKTRRSCRIYVQRSLVLHVILSNVQSSHVLRDAPQRQHCSDT